MTKHEFIASEMMRFDEEDSRPFRVAVGGSGIGAYPYGSHTERREYADHTEGYAYTKDDATDLLASAWDYAEEERERGWEEE